MVNTLEFDSNAPGSTPGPAANMGMTSERARKWYRRWKLGSTPSVSTIFAGVIQLVECCLAKANAAGSTPVSCSNACIAQLVEHTLGTGEVMRSSRIASSIWAGNSEVEWRTENSFVGGLIPPWPTI